MDSRLEKILELVKDNPVEFRRFSRDVQQVNPVARVMSISSMLEIMDLPKDMTMLDIGTGYGYGAVLLNSLGHNVVGVDVNGEKLEEGMKYWKRLGIDFHEISDAREALDTKRKLYFLKSDAGRLNRLPDQSIDMATSFYVGSYMAGENGAFSEIGRILAPEANLLVTTEGPTTLPVFLRGASVRVAGRFLCPKDLKLSKIFTAPSSQIYDRFALVYEKANQSSEIHIAF